MTKILTAGFILLTGMIINLSCQKVDNVSSLAIYPPAPDLCAKPLRNASLVPVGKLSIGRSRMISATAANKILFAGGFPRGGMGAYSTFVDIYDMTNNTWSSTMLTDRWRIGMAVATVGNKVLFAGGGDGIGDFVSSRVDIYDAVSNTWSEAELSEARSNLAAATVGNKVLFAGGWGFDYSKTVDIYDNSTNTWSKAALSEARSDLSATTVGNLICFAGGVNNSSASDVIDIFDASTNSWSVSNLLEAKSALGSIFVDNKIFWAGGRYPTSGNTWAYINHVEIRDISTGSTSAECILPNAGYHIVRKDDNLVFFPGFNWSIDPNDGIHFEIYDLLANEWSRAVLGQKILGATVISVNNTIYVAGGTNGSAATYDQVWKLEF